MNGTLKFNRLIKIEYHDPHELVAYEQNAREHKGADVEAIRASIREFGFNDPIGIWSDKNIIVEGHGRQMAAIDEGLDKVPCIRARTDPELYKAIITANKEAAKGKHKELPKYDYPDNIVTAAMMGKWSKYGIKQSFNDKESVIIDSLDKQKEVGKTIYGKGLLLSEKAAAEKAAAEKAAAEKAAAEKAAAEKAAAERWELSDREKAIVADLE